MVVELGHVGRLVHIRISKILLSGRNFLFVNESLSHYRRSVQASAGETYGRVRVHDRGAVGPGNRSRPADPGVGSS